MIAIVRKLDGTIRNWTEHVCGDDGITMEVPVRRSPIWIKKLPTCLFYEVYNKELESFREKNSIMNMVTYYTSDWQVTSINKWSEGGERIGYVIAYYDGYDGVL